MTRRQTLFQIKKVLRKWENSKLNLKCANEILTRLEELGYNNTVRVYLALLDKWRKYEAIAKTMESK